MRFFSPSWCGSIVDRRIRLSFRFMGWITKAVFVNNNVPGNAIFSSGGAIAPVGLGGFIETKEDTFFRAGV